MTCVSAACVCLSWRGTDKDKQKHDRSAQTRGVTRPWPVLGSYRSHQPPVHSWGVENLRGFIRAHSGCEMKIPDVRLSLLLTPPLPSLSMCSCVNQYCVFQASAFPRVLIGWSHNTPRYGSGVKRPGALWVHMGVFYVCQDESQIIFEPSWQPQGLFHLHKVSAPPLPGAACFPSCR